MNDRSASLDLSVLSGADHGSAIHIGRYALHRQIARGGMATIHIARLMGDEGFSRIVAAKRLLPEFATDAEFVAMFLDEARIASRVHHRNVVPVLDVVNTGDEVVLVQEYVHGVPLHWLLSRARQTKAPVPVEIAVSIACQVLAGLHAAHETTDELGTPLHVVHRDVSPQNVMIATDGTARLLDFGVAKSLMAGHVTREGTYKGKLTYSAPEQLRGAAVRQSDIYSLTVLLWELLVGHRMHRTMQAEAELVATIMNGQLPTVTQALAAQREWETISEEHWQKVRLLEPVIQRGLSLEIEDRYQTAAEMEEVLHSLVRPASGAAVAQWLRTLGKEYMDRHDKVLAAEEASWRRTTGAHSTQRRAHPTTQPLRPGHGRGPARADEPAPGASQSLSAAPAAPAAPAAAPAAHRGPYLLVALLSLLVVALAVGIVLVVSGQGEPPPIAPAAISAPVAPAAAPTAAAPMPAVAPAVAPAPAAAEAKPAPPEPVRAESPAISIGEVETRPTGASAEPARRSPARAVGAPTRPAGRPAAAKAASAPPAKAAPEPETAPAKESCNPPYYFEGTKKIFKTACL